MGAPAGILPGTDQENLGRSPVEFDQSQGILPWYGNDGGNRKPLPVKIHWLLAHGYHMVG